MTVLWLMTFQLSRLRRTDLKKEKKTIDFEAGLKPGPLHEHFV